MKCDLFKKIFSMGMAIVFVLSNILIVGHAENPQMTLTAIPKAAEDYIHLSWNPPTTDRNYTYQIYQKKPGDAEFQTIPAKQTVRVLNVYPPVGEPITFTNYKGETFTLPKAASLKMWMEKPNDEHPKGYGKGLISVDTVSLPDFNNNPLSYLKDLNGNWKYDVVFFGSYDCNGSCDSKGDLSILAKDAISAFIESGRGVLFGHDTINNGHPNFRDLRNYANIKMFGLDADPRPGSASNKISILKKGLLTNYPWSIGNVGSILTVPYTHTSNQLAYGDIWMKFATQNGPFAGEDIVDPVTGTVTNNFYLTTWNNTAMIQTGHSDGEATPDEQKVLANTLFYLAQITDQTSWDDHMGQDVAAPDQPSMPSLSFNAGEITVSVPETQDNGSEYQYYVEATSDNGKKYTSNIVTTTITSGLQGYSYVVDDKPDTVPDAIVESMSPTFTVQVDMSKGFYLHIVSVDNVGNKSEPIHVYVDDDNPPILEVTPSTTDWTNQDVVLTVVAHDEETGVKEIRLPDGTRVSGDTAVFNATENGVYEFEAVDFFGNMQAVNFVVSNIDKDPPGSPVVEVMNGKVQISHNEPDVSMMYRYDGVEWIYYVKPFNLPDGEYVLEVKSIDRAGNESIFSFHVTIYEELLKRAKSKVDLAEKYPNQSRIEQAREAIQQLPDMAPEKEGLLQRLYDLEEKLLLEEVARKVELAEKYKREPYLNNAQEAVDRLPDGDGKRTLQERLDALRQAIEQENLNKLIQEAERKVKQAENYKREPYISKAYDAVNALPDVPEKEALLDRLRALMPKDEGNPKPKDGQFNPGDNIVDVADSILDPVARKVYLDWAKAVERAEKYFSRANIVYAMNKLESVPAEMIVAYQSLYDELYGRTMVLKQLYNEMVANQELEKLISKATLSVETYERFGTERYRQQAQDAVNALPDGAVKEMLQQRIDAKGIKKNDEGV